MRIDIPPTLSPNNAAVPAASEIGEADVVPPESFLANIHQLCPELAEGEGPRESAENPIRQDPSQPDNLLSLLLGAVLLCPQPAEPALPASPNLSGTGPSEPPVDAVIKAAIPEPVAASDGVGDAPFPDANPKPAGAAPEPHAAMPSVEPDVPTGTTTSDPEKGQNAGGDEPLPTGAPRVTTMSAADDSLGVQSPPASLQPSVTLNPLIPKNSSASKDLSALMDPSAPEELSAPEDPPVAQGLPRNAAEIPLEDARVRAMLDRPARANAAGGNQSPREERAVTGSIPRVDFLVEGAARAVAGQETVARIAAAPAPATLPQRAEARATGGEAGDSAPAPQVPDPGKLPEANRRESPEHKEAASAVAASDLNDRKSPMFWIGNAQPVQMMDVDSGRAFRQGPSAPHGEGNSEVVPVITAANREAPTQAPAQVQSADRSQFFVQLAEKFQILVRNGTGEIRVQLKPENLGKLEINAQTGVHGVIARIATESGSVKSYLESNLQLLHQSFQDQGLKVERIDVLIQGGFDARNSTAQQQSHGHSGSPGSQGHSAPALAVQSESDSAPDEILVDPMTLMYLRPNSTFHTTA